MSKKLKLYIAVVVAMSAIALVATTVLFPLDDSMPIAVPFRDLDHSATWGLGLWVIATLLASAMPLRLPRGAFFAVSTSTLMAATILGGPAAGVWVGLLGTTEVRELRGRVPWYGTLANHAGIMLPAGAAGLVLQVFDIQHRSITDPIVFLGAVIGGVVFFAINGSLTAVTVAYRTGLSAPAVLASEARGTLTSVLSLAPIGWLMAQVYVIAAWATPLWALPLYMTRLAYQSYTEIREMFTETITALAEAVDKRDPFTSKHSWRVKEIAKDIGQVMRLGAAELEALEWGGLLHDVGKIGVPDHVLLKADRLTREERLTMNAHPVLGAEIIGKVSRLSAELPIIRHHHEWYNGSGYPDRLIGDEIPLLARILHVADSFEAMTAQRPYRMTPLTPEMAVGELRKFAGIQFDPKVVDAFVRTSWAEGVADPGRTVQPRPIPLIGQQTGRSAATSSAASAASTAAEASGTSAAPATPATPPAAGH